jgi:hypothetical protein
VFKTLEFYYMPLFWSQSKIKSLKYILVAMFSQFCVYFHWKNKTLYQLLYFPKPRQYSLIIPQRKSNSTMSLYEEYFFEYMLMMNIACELNTVFHFMIFHVYILYKNIFYRVLALKKNRVPVFFFFSFDTGSKHLGWVLT